MAESFRKQSAPIMCSNTSNDILDKYEIDDEQSMIGPVLPPHLSKKSINASTYCPTTSTEDIGPAFQPYLSKNSTKGNMADSAVIQSHIIENATENANLDMIGPSLPPHLIKTSLNDDAELEEKNDFANDTRLDPVEQRSDSSEAYGPALPPHLKRNLIVGPTLPDKQQIKSSDESDSDEGVVGPVPEDSRMTVAHQQLEIRAQHLKRKMIEEASQGKEEIKKRETWMLELPPEKAANLGLGPRSFRMKERPDMSDRSEWTDTPADKERKALLAQSGCDLRNTEDDMKSALVMERDKAMEKMAESCKDEKRQLSLLEMHQKERRKKLKKEKKERERKGTKSERRPFDRDIDLQANRFDDAQKKSIFKKAQLLDTRFSQGQSKFL